MQLLARMLPWLCVKRIIIIFLPFFSSSIFSFATLLLSLRQWSKSEESVRLALWFPKKDLEKQVSWAQCCRWNIEGHWIYCYNTSLNKRFGCIVFMLFPVPIPGFANVQILCWLRHCHFLLYLFDSDVCHKGVSMTSVIPYKNVLHSCHRLQSHAAETENVLKKMLETHLVFISLSHQMLGISFGVLVCVLLLTLVICFSSQLQVSVLSLT